MRPLTSALAEQQAASVAGSESSIAADQQSQEDRERDEMISDACAEVMASEEQCGRHLLNETWRGEEYGGQFHVGTFQLLTRGVQQPCFTPIK